MIKVAVLDAKTLGDDIDLAPLMTLGDVKIYDLTSPAEIESRIKDVDVVITNKVVLNESNMKDTVQLKIIALFATGYNNIDLDYAKQREIAVVNVAGYSTQSVAQHTFAMLFYVIEKLNAYDRYVKEKHYEKSNTFAYIGYPFGEISGKTWGIIGMGAIGKEVAKIAEAFGSKVIYYSTSGANTDAGYTCVSLETLLKESDIISIHAPLNPKTQDLIGYKEIEQMKSTAVLINMGRGGIVNEEDLVQALNEDLIAGAALDVLSKEPITENHPLYTVAEHKWFVTPHIAWASIEARRTLVAEVVNNIEAFFNGEKRNRVV